MRDLGAGPDPVGRLQRGEEEEDRSDHYTNVTTFLIYKRRERIMFQHF